MNFTHFFFAVYFVAVAILAFQSRLTFIFVLKLRATAAGAAANGSANKKSAWALQ